MADALTLEQRVQVLHNDYEALMAQARTLLGTANLLYQEARDRFRSPIATHGERVAVREVVHYLGNVITVLGVFR